MKPQISGTIPVMLTPYDRENDLDIVGLKSLVEWYISSGATALFAVCQSSEMQHLSLAERVQLARAVVQQTGGRIPVVASGHISGPLDEQIAELRAMSDTGIDALVLVTNRLDPKNQGLDAFKHHVGLLLSALPSDMPLGLYECPAPYRRLLNDDELKLCRDTGRFVVLKDVSCDLETVKRRVALAKDTKLAIINANAAIAHDAMKAGSPGFAGVFTNIHPDLYAWLYRNKDLQDSLVDDLRVFLALSANAEPLGYPVLAKLYHQRLGTFSSVASRAVIHNVHEKHWALEAILDHIQEGTENFQDRIAKFEARRAA